MSKKIKVYYILKDIISEKIICLETNADTKLFKKLNHKGNEYYIGFSGFTKCNQVVPIVVKYDFYYFYNMVEGIMEVKDIIRFYESENPEELLLIELNRIQKLEHEKRSITIAMESLLKTYELYKIEMGSWIKTNGSRQIIMRMENKEDIELSYLIERVNKEHMYPDSMST